MNRAIVLTSFDDVRSRDVRLIEEASRSGAVHVLLESDMAVERRTGAPPRFPMAERRYLAEAIRWVAAVIETDDPVARRSVPELATDERDVWVMPALEATENRHAFAASHGLALREVSEAALHRVPGAAGPVGVAAPSPGRSVLASGCYDWLHSGHVRFFEEAAELGALHVTVGNDSSVAAFKGAGHPMFPAPERRYMVGAVRHVHEALIATGTGWLDAAPEIARIQPDGLVVNSDGDRPEKRSYCAEHGLEYHVLRRAPRSGLPPRSSTQLRGF